MSSIIGITTNSSAVPASNQVLTSNAVGVNYIDAGFTSKGKFDELEVDGIDVKEFIKLMQRRFLILEEDFEKHKQYPALKKAYEQYKLIEKLMMDGKDESS